MAAIHPTLPFRGSMLMIGPKRGLSAPVQLEAFRRFLRKTGRGIRPSTLAFVGDVLTAVEPELDLPEVAPRPPEPKKPRKKKERVAVGKVSRYIGLPAPRPQVSLEVQPEVPGPVAPVLPSVRPEPIIETLRPTPAVPKEERFQDVREVIAVPDWDMSPDSPEGLLLGNIIRRVVNTDLRPITTNTVVTGTSANAYSAWAELNAISQRIDIYVITNDVTVQFENAAGRQLAEFKVPKDSWYFVDVEVARVRYKSSVTDAHGVIELIAWH